MREPLAPARTRRNLSSSRRVLTTAAVVLAFGLVPFVGADELPPPTPVAAAPSSPPVAAAPQAPQPDASVASAEADAMLAMRARAALNADPALTGLNVLVSVVNRAAVVGGPVPDADVVPRIEAVLRKVPGFSDVKVTCFVHAADGDPLKTEIVNRMRATSPLAGLPPLAIGVPRPDAPAAEFPPLTALPRPVPSSTGADAEEVYAIGDRRPPGTVTVQRVAASPAMGLFLEEPVGPNGVRITTLSTPAPVGLPPSEATIPPTTVPTAPAGNVPASGAAPVDATVSNLRAADARFTDLTVVVRGGTALVGGRARRDADAWEFAQVIRKVPGIDRVVMGRVDAR